MKTRLEKYMVISWDNDEQQVFWDWVLARSEEAAQRFIETHRPYTVGVVDVIPSYRFVEMAASLRDAKVPEIIPQMKRLVDQFVEEGGYA